jgi:glycosyltransferase involved in cell wall biosynthesis
MRILMTADAVGGVWQYAIELARALVPLGVEPVLALLGPAPDAAQAGLAPDGIEVIETGLPLDWLAPDAAAVRRAGKAIADLGSRHGADLVQLNSPALAAEADFGVPVLAVNHSCLATWWKAVLGSAPDGDFRWRAERNRAGLIAADAVITPTRSFAEATAAANGLSRIPGFVHNGRTPLRTPRVASHDFAFTAGRLWDKGKNVTTLDRAAERLAIPLYAAGPVAGPNGDCVALQHARPIGLVDEAELARRLAARPVFASAALYEPFGLAVLEAAAAGCPLVLADIPTFRELWDGAAIFVDPLDDRGFAEAIGETACDDALHRQMGSAARQRALRYTPQAMASQMAALYRRLAAPIGAPGAEALVAA